MKRKLLIPFLATSLFLTACSTQFGTSATEQPKTENKQETTSNTTQQDTNSTEKATETKTIQHDLVKAKETANKYNLVYQGKPSLVAAFHYNLSINKRIESTHKLAKVEFANVSQTYLADLVDFYNEVTPNIYNEVDVLSTIKNMDGKNFREVEDDFEASGRDVVLEANRGDLIYFKKNKVFVSIVGGLGGATLTTLDKEENWTVEGDKIIVPLINQSTNTNQGNVVLKINEKKYTGGNKVSMYYIESVETKFN